eukprot:TRINITY_DN12349_c0_g1_i1.p1 TRINITY_DN12349_c0_g1~~TRINITY_DN12349_c0_g1_i1.p1  ORF type:complete len:196 (-),score=47.26 TRINITY_DN12349_c0_g1_i1:23-610(-)
MNQKAPVLNGLQFIKGEPISVNDFIKGKVYVLEFWATWCPPCRQTIPHLSQLQHQYGDAVAFIGITDEDIQTVSPFVNQMGHQMDYRVAIDTLHDAQNKYSRAFRQNGIPHAFVIDKLGRVAWVGHPADGQMDVEIRNALSQEVLDLRSLSNDELMAMSVSKLKSLMRENGLSFNGLLEKREFIDRIRDSFPYLL